MTDQLPAFRFGRNWEKFIKKHFSEERVDISRRHLLDLLKLDNLQGKSFLDVGCGSGLHSLAALEAGAAEVVSFDVDTDSVGITTFLRDRSRYSGRWTVRQGSVLDEHFLEGLKPADVVYSWGVLHHTGDMWRAMDNTVRLTKPGGLLYLALYDYEIQVDPPAEFWLKVKRRYNQSTRLGKRLMELWYIWRFILHRNPFRIPLLCLRFMGYKRSRGMAFYTDLVDWLGGWPMEFAKRAEVKDWSARHNLTMLTMKTGQANTEYLFQKKLSPESPVS